MQSLLNAFANNNLAHSSNFGMSRSKHPACALLDANQCLVHMYRATDSFLKLLCVAEARSTCASTLLHATYCRRGTEGPKGASALAAAASGAQRFELPVGWSMVLVMH